MKFIHAADLHLDSPLKGISAHREEYPEVVTVLRESGFRAFDNLVHLCLDEEVDFLVVSGDVFDGAQRGLSAHWKFAEGLKRLGEAGIRSFVCHGNHDPLSGRSLDIQMHDLVTVFGPEVSEHRIDGLDVRLIGKSYGEREETENPAQAYTVAREPGTFGIGVLHASVGASEAHSTYAPCSITDLEATNLDYLALGHIHQHSVLSEAPWIVYPGCLQGRHIREAGARGCVVVEVEHGRAAIQFRPLDVVRWQALEIDVSDLETVNPLIERIEQEIEDSLDQHGERDLCLRLVLAGRTQLDSHLRGLGGALQVLDHLRQQFAVARRPFAWVQDLRLLTRPAVDLETRAREDDLLGMALGIGLEARGDPEALQAVLEMANSEMSSSKAGGVVGAFTEADVHEALADAMMICLESIEGSEAAS